MSLSVAKESAKPTDSVRAAFTFHHARGSNAGSAASGDASAAPTTRSVVVTALCYGMRADPILPEKTPSRLQTE